VVEAEAALVKVEVRVMALVDVETTPVELDCRHRELPQLVLALPRSSYQQ